MADISLLDLPEVSTSAVTDLMHISRGTGSDRDKSIQLSNLLGTYTGALKAASLVTTGNTTAAALFISGGQNGATNAATRKDYVDGAISTAGNLKIDKANGSFTGTLSGVNINISGTMVATGSGTFGNFKAQTRASNNDFSAFGHSVLVNAGHAPFLSKNTGDVYLRSQNNTPLQLLAYQSDTSSSKVSFTTQYNATHQHDFTGTARFQGAVTGTSATLSSGVEYGLAVESTWAGTQGIRIKRSGGDEVRFKTSFTGFGGGLESDSALRFSTGGSLLSSPALLIATNNDMSIAGKILPQVTQSSWSNLTGVTSNTIKVEKYPDGTAHIQGDITVGSGFSGQFLCQVSGNPFGMVAGNACKFIVEGSSSAIKALLLNYNGSNTQILYSSTQSGSDFMGDITAVCPIPV